MALEPTQNNVPHHLLNIANYLQLSTEDPVEDVQDACFSAIWNTCKENKWEIINSLKIYIVQLVNTVGQSLVEYSIAERNLDIFERLISNGITFHLVDEQKNSLIHHAAEAGLLQFVEKLFEFNLTSEKNKNNQTPLHIAALRGHEKIVSYLLQKLQKRPQVLEFLAKYPYGSTFLELPPLGFAVVGGHIACADVFLEHPHIDWRIKFPGIGNLLHLAIFFQHNALLQRFLTLYQDKFSYQIEEKNDRGQTPLMLAAFIGNTFAIDLLIKKRAYIDCVNFNGDTALHWAVQGNQKNAVTVLVANQADLRAQNEDKLTPAQLAEKLRSPLWVFLANIESAGEIPNQKAFEMVRPRVLAFQGGGIKGLIHGGMIMQLENLQMLSDVAFSVGTSAGAMIAGLFAVNTSGAQIIQIQREVNFITFFEDAASKFEPNQGLLKKAYNISSALTTRSLWRKKGLCTGEALRLLMEEKIHKQTGVEYFTFGELRKEIETQPEKKYKHLHVFASKLGPNQKILDINSEDPQWDDVILSDGIRASVSIPLVFEAHRLHIKVLSSNGKVERKPHPENYVLVDGGMLYNLALERFDRKRYFTSNYTEADKDLPVFNSRALGLGISGPVDELMPDREPASLKEHIKNLALFYFNAEGLTRKINPHNQSRIIVASSLNIGTLEFGISEETKDQMIASGTLAIKNSIESRLKDFNNVFEFNFPPQKERVKKVSNTEEVIYTELPANEIGVASGVYFSGISESLSCKKINKEQWIYFKEKELDVGKVANKMRCSCCQTQMDISRIALVDCSATLRYGDNQGKHEKKLRAANHQAQIIEFKHEPTFIEIKQ